MTEQEWLQASNPEPMLEYLQGKASDRKLWLFGVACCRRIWHLLEDQRSRAAVEVVERWADGQASKAEMVAAYEEADNAADCSGGGPALTVYDLFATANTFNTFNAINVASRRASGAIADAAGSNSAAAVENVCQVSLLHDLFGNPFLPVVLAPAWLRWHDGLLISIARQMYESRDFADMPILADALEEAGCTEAEILMHCRQPGEHVRGCWVVDLILGKE